MEFCSGITCPTGGELIRRDGLKTFDNGVASWHEGEKIEGGMAADMFDERDGVMLRIGEEGQLIWGRIKGIVHEAEKFGSGLVDGP